jgi:hypothetical protein
VPCGRGLTAEWNDRSILVQHSLHQLDS